MTVPARVSSMCRREEHVLCTTAGAFCGCSCHGDRGTTPPKPKEAPVAASVTPLPHLYTCEECGQGFPRAQSLGVHRRYKHGEPTAKRKAQTPPRPKPSPKPSPAPKAESAQHVLIVQHDGQAHVVQLQTLFDALAMTDLLARLGIDARRYVEATGEP